MNKSTTSLSTNGHAQYYLIYGGFLKGFLRKFPGNPLQASLLLVGIYVFVKITLTVLTSINKQIITITMLKIMYC